MDAPAGPEMSDAGRRSEVDVGAVSPLECVPEMAHAGECSHRQLLARVRYAVASGPRAAAVAFAVRPALLEQNAVEPAQNSQCTLLETNPKNELLFSYTSFLAPLQITTFCKQFSGQAGINLRARWRIGVETRVYELNPETGRRCDVASKTSALMFHRHNRFVGWQRLTTRGRRSPAPWVARPCS